MRKMEVFFDYACPYCLRGHEYLIELLRKHPDVEPVWQPCEAHPRPEPGTHSDLCIQAMHEAAEQGADLWAFHDRMYRACLRDHIDIEDAAALSEYARGALPDADALRAALMDRRHEAVQLAGNDYAYERSGVWALPSYRMDGKKLDSIEGVGVTKAQLDAFMS